MAKQKNPYLKRAHEQHDYTIDEIAEIQRCMDDPVYFIKTYCQIQHPTRGAIPFRLYPYQEKMLWSYKNNRQNIVLSARQTGKCFPLNTTVVTVDKSNINIIKRLLLWLFDRKTYNDIFKNMHNMQE